MVTSAEFRAIALALEGTSEAPHFDRAAFKVARIYATLAADGESANLKLTRDTQELKCLTAPDLFKPVAGGWGRMGWTTVALPQIEAGELASALEAAWREALPHARASSSGRPARSSKARPGGGAAPEPPASGVGAKDTKAAPTPRRKPSGGKGDARP